MSSKKQTVTKLESVYMEQYDAYIERKKRKKKRLIRRLVLFSILTVLAFGFMINYHLNQREVYAEKRKEYEELNVQLEELKNEEKQLQEEIELLKSTDYVLDIARTNYFFSKEGELIFKVPEEDPAY